MFPRFDAFCTVCAERFTYCLVVESSFDFAHWLATTDRLQVRCSMCDTNAMILFGESPAEQEDWMKVLTTL